MSAERERSQVIRHRGGPLVLIAGAGAGKTTLIAQRFMGLAEEGMVPSRIAVLTPSRGRAEALRERLETALTRGYEELAVGTPVELSAVV
ncbi:MAG: UvrD-helicase domain-containing protein, partial [Solirubrobacterales bacterium]|nr:UvrD-helicase domain-containing protein [Solirubrobacterales bacterium]